MKRFLVLGLVSSSLLAVPVIAGPTAKRPYCQVPKSPVRDIRREPCRKPPIPPVIDRTPIYLISTAGRTVGSSDLS